MSFPAFRQAAQAFALVWLAVALLLHRPVVAAVPAALVAVIVYRGALAGTRDRAAADAGRPRHAAVGQHNSGATAPPSQSALNARSRPDVGTPAPDAPNSWGEAVRARAAALLRIEPGGPVDINFALGTIAHHLAFEIGNRELFAFLDEHARRQRTDSSHEAFYRAHGISPEERATITPVLGLVLVTRLMAELRQEGERVEGMAMLPHLHPMVLTKGLSLRGADREHALREEVAGPLAATIKAYRAVFADDDRSMIDATHRELIETWWRAVDRYVVTGDEPWIDLMTTGYPIFVRGIYRPAAAAAGVEPQQG